MKRKCQHIDRKVFADGRCKPCAMIIYAQKRSEKLRAIPISEKKKPSQISTQRTLLNTIYKMLCAELKPKHKKCQANLLGCSKNATEIHHMRGKRGILLILSTFFKYVCNNCHRHITTNSAEAKELGLSLPINSSDPLIITPREQELIEKYKVRVPHNANIILY